MFERGCGLRSLLNIGIVAGRAMAIDGDESGDMGCDGDGQFRIMYDPHHSKD